MRTASAKAKGRRLQDLVRGTLRELGKVYGLQDADITSAIMGTSGVDILFSPAARAIFNLAIECKNCESLNVMTTFYKHYDKYQNEPSLKLLVHSKNRTEPLVTLRYDDFMKMLSTSVAQANVPKSN